jgi:hypothetical protein
MGLDPSGCERLTILRSGESETGPRPPGVARHQSLSADIWVTGSLRFPSLTGKGLIPEAARLAPTFLPISYALLRLCSSLTPSEYLTWPEPLTWTEPSASTVTRSDLRFPKPSPAQLSTDWPAPQHVTARSRVLANQRALF